MARLPRTCLYLPEVENGPNDSFIPVFVQEGSHDASLSSMTLSSEDAYEDKQVVALNAANGLTLSDALTISRRFRQLEPKDELILEFEPPSMWD